MKSLTTGSFVLPAPHTEWNVTLESYVVHTNYDEYAIFLTKKFSHHHGPTVTAKLYGKGLNNESVGAGVREGWVRDYSSMDHGWEGAGSLPFLCERTPS